MNLITAPTFDKARNLLKTAKHPVLFTSNDDELNRKILEKLETSSSLASSKLGRDKEKIDVLLINLKGRKDYQKQRNSGLDNVMAREAGKKGVVIGINLDEFLEGDGKSKELILARINQNIELCKKHKVKMMFIGKTKKDIHELRALGLVLGMPTWMLTFFN